MLGILFSIQVAAATGVSAWTTFPAEGGGSISYQLPAAGDADYPAQAKREEGQGTAYVRLTIGLDGQITDCAIARTAGRDDLDRASCVLYRTKGRFKVFGRREPAIVTAPVVWRLEG